MLAAAEIRFEWFVIRVYRQTPVDLSNERKEQRRAYHEHRDNKRASHCEIVPDQLQYTIL